MYSIIEINGGIGKSIMATAVVAGIKREYPDRKLLVITAYPEVFLSNPNVDRVFRFGNCPYFYDDYVKDKDTIFFCNEPYRSNGYLTQSKHLIEAWGDDLGVECEVSPSLYLNTAEMQFAAGKFFNPRPILLFQPFGGASGQAFDYSWNRDIPIKQAQAIVNVLADHYCVVQPIHDKTIKLENCEHVNVPLRELFCLVYLSSAIIGIDSCVQHAAKALNKEATVCWISNSPKVFGYETHKNIMPNYDNYGGRKDLIDGYFHGYDFTGSRLYDYPFINDEVFNVEEILSTIP